MKHRTNQYAISGLLFFAFLALFFGLPSFNFSSPTEGENIISSVFATKVFAQGGNSCFIGDSQVRLADGSLKAIRDIKEGDQVLGGGGKIGTVIKVENPYLGLRRLYSINGSNAFVTPEHPLFTTEGWKSIDPRATERENPNYHLASLRVGDTLLTENGSVRVESVSPAVFAPNTPVYHLWLSGAESYFVNGFEAMATYYPEDVQNQ